MVQQEEHGDNARSDRRYSSEVAEVAYRKGEQERVILQVCGLEPHTLTRDVNKYENRWRDEQ